MLLLLTITDIFKIKCVRYHGYWLYDNDEAELQLDDTTELFIWPKLPSVHVVPLSRDVAYVPSGAPTTLAEAGAEHQSEFQITNVERPNQDAGSPPRDICLILYFQDQDDEDDDDDDDDSEDDSDDDETNE